MDRFWSPKISTERTVTFKDSLHWWLAEWINGGYRDSYPAASSSEYLFVTHQSEKMQNDRPTTIVVQAAEDAGIQEIRKVDQRGREWNSITSHAVRRGHAMHLLKNGVDLRTIQKRLGHSKLETTTGYLPISPEDAGDQIEDITF